MPELSPPVLKSSIEYFAMSVGIGETLMPPDLAILPIWESIREIIYLLVYDLRLLGPARPSSRRLTILNTLGGSGVKSSTP